MTKNENAYIVGIIAEYNPLHKGHAWHIQKAKELAGAKYCIAVMSGDFVQRGAPALFDKYARTAMALEAGADLLLMPADFKEAYTGVLDAVKTGELTEQRLDQSLERILRVKLELSR